MTPLDRLRAAVGNYSSLCPVPCEDLRAALEAIEALQDLVSEIASSEEGHKLWRSTAFVKAKDSLQRLGKG
jgi:hypothetical protein